MTIRVGTDCSGIEAPIHALKQLNIQFVHVFACEKDPYAIQSIKANYTPLTLYDDITTRDHAKVADIDLYVCGFPCQPFSTLGLKNGTLDIRGNIMFHCISVIENKKPKVFILENVKNFKFIQNGSPFNFLIDSLSTLGIYTIHVDILNTKDYGIPQNRERVFIVGIRRDVQTREYTSPLKLPIRPLDDFIIDKRICSVKPNSNGLTVIKKHKLYDLNCIVACAGFGNYMYNMSPTLTCGTVYYLTKYKRYLFPREMLLLQGFDKTFVQVVSDTQLRRQAGNTMSVNVLKEIFKQVFKVCSFS
jgi:DNA (cytosine-5)-methyltransferase 1